MILSTDGRLREKTQLYCDENRWRFFCLLRIIQESGVYQLGVPQGQGDSSAPNTIDPLICGFCLVTTPNTRGKTVEQSIVTWMFAREFITNNRHPGEPQLTNKPCTNGCLREKHNCTVMRIDEDSSAYSESFKRVERTNWDYRMDGRTDRWTRWNQYTPLQLRWAGGIIKQNQCNENEKVLSKGLKFHHLPVQSLHNHV